MFFVELAFKLIYHFRFYDNNVYNNCNLIRVLRSGCGFVHIDSGSWTKSVQSCRKVLKMRYLILHDNVFLENSKFLLEHIEEQQYIEVVIHGNSEIFRLVKLKEHVPEIDSITPPEPYEYAYAIQTSGSTGKKKMVLVSNNKYNLA